MAYRYDFKPPSLNVCCSEEVVGWSRPESWDMERTNFGPPMTLWLVGGPYISFLPPNLFQTSCSIFNSPENTAIQAIEYAHIGFQV